MNIADIFNLNILDVVIILLILCAGVVGLKRGFFKEIVMTIGLLLVYVISFKLKDPIANWMSMNLPFFKFGGVFEGATALNIIVYQTIAFIIVFSLIMIIFRIILSLTGALEKILNFTIILGIPSKILGFIVGIIEGYILVFMFVFIISMPFFRIDVIEQSKYRKTILNSSPLLSNVAHSTNNAINDIYKLGKNFSNKQNVNYLNDEIINVLLKYDVVTDEYISKLKAAGKI